MDVWDASSPAVERGASGFGEVEDVFVAVVDVASAVDGFEVSGADEVSLSGFHGDGFDPVKGVLQGEEWFFVCGFLGKGEQELVGE